MHGNLVPVKVKFVLFCLESIVTMFMPPTLKKLMGHIAFGACVGRCMGGCVGHTFCTYCNF